MSFDHDEKAGPQVYGGILTINRVGLQDNTLLECEVRRKLANQLASNLSHDAIQKTEGQYSDEYRLHVYVLTPAQLERLVQQRAERLHPSMPSMQWVHS